MSSLRGAHDVTFIRSWGNVGDELIYAGTRALLRDLPYREESLMDLGRLGGELAVLSGGGAWCTPFHEVLPAALGELETRFERVVIFPSSFDTRVEEVGRALAGTRAKVFAREPVSLAMIRDLCDAELSHDCAFFFDFRPYRRQGEGVLKAFRTDAESALERRPEGNVDISTVSRSLEEWLQRIAEHDEVHTDRAHVMIAAAMLGKRVRYRPSTYHKVPAIAEWALRGFPVTPLDPVRV